ncbi:sensor histidine kinase [Dysgonomonas sp. 216]|uniref:sensor histidine kinase n=1 Tax=Dysgonomonas sp. 216 TaxID=2302934 RepID=UPI0013D1151A|nr:HAMP domain-containing sensor histidine kinase [Dysgonomonas sp. 216]NDW19576.1 sensor histidine kinase [Dysgonomonas sp. 216]
MNLQEHNNLFKYLFIAVAVIIATSSLVVSNYLIEDLSREERQKIELWAEAMRIAASTEDENTDTNIILRILSGNETVPVILCDVDDNVMYHMNIDMKDVQDSALYLKKKVIAFKKNHDAIEIDNDAFKQYVYYDDSYTLKRLQIYPFIQLGVLTIFILTSFLALLSTKKAEQNKVWVGLSKETAHQLGTPISSLMAWTEYMKLKDPDSSIAREMDKDVERLQIVADRFSKIGSMPDPDLHEFKEVVTNSINYLQNRISKKVSFSFNFPEEDIYVNLNNSLFSWVIENLTKNAVDAMEGKGSINYTITKSNGTIFLDISDTGKGIPKSRFKTVFSPGFTTKARGWGLGLSLTKRIIESYHNGKIYVKSSEIGVGTTFRIELKAAKQQS